MVSFSPGQVVLRRHFMGTVLSRVWVGRVACADERGVLIWIADGSPWLDLLTVDGLTPRQLDFPSWMAAEKRLAPLTWRNGVLMWHPSGQPYSIWYFFEPGFTGWYANLEVPAVHWGGPQGSAGVDTIDWDLDVEVAPDRSWRWKDEGEFTERLGYPDDYWVADEREVRAAGAEVVKLVEAGGFPFDGTWTDFRPDPDWPVPAGLPDGWDRPRAW